jgi:ABC-type branched-subunit amino acid transport system ATPase component
MLQTTDLTIRFGGHVAVNAVSCRFEPGTLTAIVGPNGAGKTTYFNLISGQLKASAGTVSLNGRELSGLSASARTRAGLGRAFQLTNLFPNLPVLENVRLAVQAAHDGRGHGRPGHVARVARPRREWIAAKRTQILARVNHGRQGPGHRPPRCRTATSASSRWRC